MSGQQKVDLRKLIAGSSEDDIVGVEDSPRGKKKKKKKHKHKKSKK